MDFKSFAAIIIMFLVPFLLVLIPVYLGERTGRFARRKYESIKDIEIGPVVGASFGLLAFMLAFTFQIAAGRYDARKALLLDEVTNIRTTYLRAELLPEPVSSESRNLLSEYVDLRAELANDPSKLGIALSRSEEILDRLWAITIKLAEEDRSSEIYALFTQSVNDLFNNYNHRITMTFEYRVPPIVLGILVIISFISMFILGLQYGISGKKGFMISLLLAFVFAMVMFLIVALNHPETGLIKLNTKPVFTLQQQLKSM
jgi:hypothetical protein